MLTFAEHISEAADCLQISQELVTSGRRRQASDILWLAVKHAISAIAIATGQDYGKYQHKQAVVRRLADATGDDQLLASLKVAMRIHADADQGFLSILELVIRQRQTYSLVEQLLNIATESNPATLTPPPEQPN